MKVQREIDMDMRPTLKILSVFIPKMDDLLSNFMYLLILYISFIAHFSHFNTYFIGKTGLFYNFFKNFKIV